MVTMRVAQHLDPVDCVIVVAT